MDIDPMDMAEPDDEGTKDKAKSRLNAMVAVTVALLATFLGVCKVKDDNIVQAMQQAQAQSISAWSTFHAKSTEVKVLTSAADEMEVLEAGSTGAVKAKAESEIKQMQAKAAEETKEKDDWQKTGKGDDDQYNNLNYKDDQFDLSDTLAAIAISMLAVTALTQKRWLFWVALVPTGLAVLMGVAGLFNLKIHPDAITNLLSLFLP